MVYPKRSNSATKLQAITLQMTVIVMRYKDYSSEQYGEQTKFMIFPLLIFMHTSLQVTENSIANSWDYDELELVIRTEETVTRLSFC
jgi:hypothetical protein